MAQYEVFENPNSETSKQFPYLLEVQSDLFGESNRAVYVPLVNVDLLKKPDTTLNPKFNVSGKVTRMFPLDIAAASRSVVGEKIDDLREDSDRIVAALDLLFARY